MRPQSTSGRQKIAERLYQLLIKAFNTHDFTEWVENLYVYVDFNTGLHNYYDALFEKREITQRTNAALNEDYFDVLPPYSSGFVPYLGYKFCILKPVEVGTLLDTKFPNPDVIDCDYIDDIIAEIQNTVEEGYGFDPVQPDGLDYEFSVERIFHSNIESGFRWLVRHRTRLSKLPVQSPVEHQPEPLTPQVPIPAISIPLQWLGQVADLAELLHRLEKGGTISLKSYFDKGGKGVDLCRGFANVFAFREEKAVDNLNGYLSHLKKSVGPGEIDWDVMRKIGRKRGGKMGDILSDETS